MNLQVVLSCEHASNALPDHYQYLFHDAEKDLNSHKGWDPGAIEIMTELAESLQVPSYHFDYSRLLIEPNRSMNSPHLFSSYSVGLSSKEKDGLIEAYYQPYRNKVESAIRKSILDGAIVLHLSIHSFTPLFDGLVRSTDIGILFDPSRVFEAEFGALLKSSFDHVSEDIRVDFNLPYKGTDDGLTTFLRTKFDDRDYAGIEIEINQRFISDGFESIRQIVREAITISIDNYENRRTGDQGG